MSDDKNAEVSKVKVGPVTFTKPTLTVTENKPETDTVKPPPNEEDQ